MADSSATHEPPDDPTLIATRKIAEAAKAMVTEMTNVVTAASDRIGNNTGDCDYGRKDLLKTAMELTTAGVLGGLRLAETALTVSPKRPSEGMVVMSEHLANVAQRTLANVKGVAEETSDQLKSGAYTSAHAIRSLTKLADIAVISGLETAETVVIGPAKYAPPTFISDPYTVADADANGTLEVVVDFRRPASAEAIPRARIRFDPPELRPGNNTFRMVVDEGGLPSGVYFGTVQVSRDGKSVLDSIEVAIRL
jgi:hypothetical protein